MKTERIDFICNFVNNNIDVYFNDQDWIAMNNSAEVDGFHVDSMEEFNTYVEDEAFLDTYERLSSRFDMYDDYFSDAHGEYTSSRDIFDLVDRNDVINSVCEIFCDFTFKNDENPDFSYWSTTNCGIERLYEACKEQFPADPQHTEEDIIKKTREYLETLSNDEIYELSELEGSPLYKMEDFVKVIHNKSMHTAEVVTALVKSLPGYSFDFDQEFFTIDRDDNWFMSCTRTDAVTQVFYSLDRVVDDALGITFPTLAEIRKGVWED